MCVFVSRMHAFDRFAGCICRDVCRRRRWWCSLDLAWDEYMHLTRLTYIESMKPSSIYENKFIQMHCCRVRSLWKGPKQFIIRNAMHRLLWKHKRKTGATKEKKRKIRRITNAITTGFRSKTVTVVGNTIFVQPTTCAMSLRVLLHKNRCERKSQPVATCPCMRDHCHQHNVDSGAECRIDCQLRVERSRCACDVTHKSTS